jgi:hypothetical protein
MKGWVALYRFMPYWPDRVVWVYLKMGVKSRKNQSRESEYWNAGILEYWSTGKLELGVLE